MSKILIGYGKCEYCNKEVNFYADEDGFWYCENCNEKNGEINE